MNRYVKSLKKRGLKVTAPRLEILRYLDRTKGHPTVDKIYTSLKKKNPSLSRTTVYNTLEQMKEKGMICSLSITDKEQRYDINTDPHQHFLCTGCGLIIEVECNCPKFGRLLFGKHRIDEYHGYLKGVCNKCLKNERIEG